MNSSGPGPICGRFRDGMNQRLPTVRCHRASSLTCATGFWSATNARNLPALGAPSSGPAVGIYHTEVSLSAISTVHTLLDRHGLVGRGRRLRYKAEDTALEQLRRLMIYGASTTRASSCSSALLLSADHHGLRRLILSEPARRGC